MRKSAFLTISLLLVALCIFSFASGTARADEDVLTWRKCMKITFDGYVPPGNTPKLLNFPVLVIFSETDDGDGFYYNDFLSPPYDDLRFATEDKATLLDFEVEKWDPNGDSYVWVKVPELTASTSIYACWSKAGVDLPASSTDGSVWSEDYIGVWHMNQVNARNSTMYSLNATAEGPVTEAVGKVDGANQLNGSTTVLKVISLPVLEPANQATFSVWVKPTGAGTHADAVYMFSKSRSLSYSQIAYGLAYDRNNRAAVFALGTGSSSSLNDAGAAPPMADNVFYYVVGTYDGAAMKLYRDGVLQATLAKTGDIDYRMEDHNLHFGNWGGAAGWMRFLNGVVDEARISGVVREPDWIWAEYQNMADNSGFMTYSAPSFSAIKVGLATNVLSTSAWLTGTLVTTGSYATAVSFYWGLTDGGENHLAWGYNELLPAPQPLGPLSIHATGLQSDSTYFYRLKASSPELELWSKPSVFITGEVGLEWVNDAVELNQFPGKAKVSRNPATTDEPLTVYYTVSGTATPGDDYEPLSGEVTIPASQESVEILINPYYDHLGEGDETVILTLEQGPYIIAAAASEATVKIIDHGQVTCTWTGSTSSDWFDQNNWDVGKVPYIGAKAVINDGAPNNALIVGETHPLLSLEINGGQLVFDDWASKLVCREITINGGEITHEQNAASASPWEPNARVYLECSNLTIAADGMINVTNRGYIGSYNSNGRGPGQGSYSSATYGGIVSGGHGGIGLPFHVLYAYGNTYDDVAEPLLPGSSGGAYYAGIGGPGGGVVYINAAGKVQVDGVIAANGGSNWVSTGRSAGGAGGSIYIRCSTFAGEGGLIDVSGGRDCQAGGIAHGGGGRIALHYNSALQALEPHPQVVFRAQSGDRVNYASAMGTLFLSDDSWVRAPFSQFDGVWLYGVWLEDFTIAGDFMPTNSIGFGEPYGKVRVTGDLFLSNVCFGVGQGVEFSCHDITLTNNASMTLQSALVTVTNVTTPEYGALVDASGEVVINSGCWVYPQVFPKPYTGVDNTKGVASLFKAHTMTIHEDAGFDSDKFGYPGGDLYGSRWGNGAGAGGGLGAGLYNVRGASHGGPGIGATEAYCYGSVFAPVLPGSGGASGGYGVLGYTGGGAVHVEVVGVLNISGIITANASDDGSGSGGSIFLTCDELHGSQTAALRAEGRLTGGGGRISIAVGLPERDIQNLLNGKHPSGLTTTLTLSHPNYEGQISAAGGVYYGTVCIINYTPIGTMLTVY